MQQLWIILRWSLPPNDPVQQCIVAAKHRIALKASEVFSPQSLFLLEPDTGARLHIEALITDYEAAIHMAIGARACQIAKMRFQMHPRACFKPTRALSTQRLLARIRARVTMCNNIERLVQIRAERLKRERDADPLGLAAHGSPNALNGAWLRHAAQHEAVGVAHCRLALILRDHEAIVSKNEGGLTARGPRPQLSNQIRTPPRSPACEIADARPKRYARMLARPR